jgi:hypothetical protein
MTERARSMQTRIATERVGAAPLRFTTRLLTAILRMPTPCVTASAGGLSLTNDYMAASVFGMGGLAFPFHDMGGSTACVNASSFLRNGDERREREASV